MTAGQNGRSKGLTHRFNGPGHMDATGLKFIMLRASLRPRGKQQLLEKVKLELLAGNRATKRTNHFIFLGCFRIYILYSLC